MQAIQNRLKQHLIKDGQQDQLQHPYILIYMDQEYYKISFQLKGIMYFELILILAAVMCVIDIEQYLLHVILCVTIGVSAIFVLLYGLKLAKIYQFSLFVRIIIVYNSIIIMGGIPVFLITQPLICSFMSLGSIIILVIISKCCTGSFRNFFKIYVITYWLISIEYFTCIPYHKMQQFKQNVIISSAIPTISCIFLILYISCKMIRTDLLTAIQKVTLLNLIYILIIPIISSTTIILNVLLIPLLYGALATVPSHFLLIGILVYYINIRNQHRRIRNRLEKQRIKKRKHSQKQRLLYSKTASLLSTQEKQQNIRQSVIDKPLITCLICQDQQSQFCYANCKHACIGINCSTYVIEQGIKKCPLCRESSNLLIRVQRSGPVEFSIIGKYRIKSKI